MKKVGKYLFYVDGGADLKERMTELKKCLNVDMAFSLISNTKGNAYNFMSRKSYMESESDFTILFTHDDCSKEKVLANTDGIIIDYPLKKLSSFCSEIMKLMNQNENLFLINLVENDNEVKVVNNLYKYLSKSKNSLFKRFITVRKQNFIEFVNTNNNEDKFVQSLLKIGNMGPIPEDFIKKSSLKKIELSKEKMDEVSALIRKIGRFPHSKDNFTLSDGTNLYNWYFDISKFINNSQSNNYDKNNYIGTLEDFHYIIIEMNKISIFVKEQKNNVLSDKIKGKADAYYNKVLELGTLVPNNIEFRYTDGSNLSNWYEYKGLKAIEIVNMIKANPTYKVRHDNMYEIETLAYIDNLLMDLELSQKFYERADAYYNKVVELGRILFDKDKARFEDESSMVRWYNLVNNFIFGEMTRLKNDSSYVIPDDKMDIIKVFANIENLIFDLKNNKLNLNRKENADMYYNIVLKMGNLVPGSASDIKFKDGTTIARWYCTREMLAVLETKKSMTDANYRIPRICMYDIETLAYIDNFLYDKGKAKVRKK